MFKFLKNIFFQNSINADDNGGTISPAIIKEYNNCRPYGPKPVLCYAPFKSMYFDIDGRVGACGLSFKEYEKYPDKSIKEIWNGEKFRKHREMILKNDLSFEFNVCKNQLVSKNFFSTKAIWYDKLSLNENYPVLMEFELDNNCNLECVMCNATKSSSIRRKKNITKTYQSPYDSNFVKQLDEFIPHLEKAIFIGGEPFLIKIYYDIWEKMAVLNPGMIINVNSNGTILNDKIRNVISKSNFEFNLSVDSLNKSTYEKIRVNASFENTMDNLHYFRKYCEERNTQLYISPCPMKYNWEEMPEFVKFCNDWNITLFLYTLFQPYDLALWTYSSSKLKEICLKLGEFEFPENSDIEKHNNIQYKSLISQVKTWYNEALARENNIVPFHLFKDNKNSKEKLLKKISDYINGKAEYNVTDANSKVQIYISVINDLVNNLPSDIDQKVLFEKLCTVDVSLLIEQLEINDGQELVDQAKMLYYTSYLA
jgi:MoaA/NifB/PqqE/SkfB family radical SAM enzyme